MMSSYDHVNISSLNKVIGVSRQSIYATFDRLSDSSNDKNLLKLTTRSKPAMPSTKEVKKQ